MKKAKNTVTFFPFGRKEEGHCYIIPAGWSLVGVRKLKPGDFILDAVGEPHPNPEWRKPITAFVTKETSSSSFRWPVVRPKRGWEPVPPPPTACHTRWAIRRKS